MWKRGESEAELGFYEGGYVNDVRAAVEREVGVLGDDEREAAFLAYGADGLVELLEDGGAELLLLRARSCWAVVRNFSALA